jgi:hypothetical protein
MGISAGVMAAATVAGAYMTSQGQQNAANTQAQAGLQAQQNLLGSGQQASQNYAPYTSAGTTALNQLTGQLPYFSNQFSNQDLNANLAPNYAFQLQQGQAGQNAAANATGGLVGGNAQQALSQYNQNYAQGAYQNAFNNYQAQRTNIYNQLAGIAGIGLTGTQGQSNAQLGTATNIANVTQGIANAQAASQIGQANTYGGALSSLGNIAGTYGLMNSTPTAGATTSLGSLNYQTPTIGATPTNYTNMGGSGYGIGGFSQGTASAPIID